MLRIGSMCSGYGGLDMGAAEVFGGGVVWNADPDSGASAILAHNHPDTPNYGDIRDVDWSAVPPVDILTAGFPCQPVSLAGKRAGTEDERWLFDDIAHAIRAMGARPRVVLFENVRGLLTANGGRAMARVAHEMARLGYMGRYRVVRASDAGAPHQRARVFILGTLADSVGEFWQGGVLAGNRGGQSTESLRDGGRASADSASLRPERCGEARTGWGGSADRRVSVADPASVGRSVGRSEGRPGAAREQRRHAASGGGRASREWGEYAPAIQRWERILGRPAPEPTEPNRNGRPSLSAAFTEWVMGLPEGWVTDVPGLSRARKIKALGNGVVPQQAALAITQLIHA